MRRMLAWGRRRPTWAAAALYAVLAVAFFSPALVPGQVLSHSDTLLFSPPWNAQVPADLERPGNPEVADAPAILYPFVQYTRESLPDVPLWNPHIQSGRPFVANSQSALMSPFSLPSYVLPFWESLAWVAILKLFVAAFGTYLLGRALGMRFGGALLAGTAFGFNLWLVEWITYPHSSVWALIPLLLWSVERVVRRPDPLTGSALSVAIAAVLVSGHPESAFHALFCATLFGLLRVVQARRAGWGTIGRPLLVGGLALAGAVALAAAVLLPAVELILRSADIEQRAGSAVEATTKLRYALAPILPGYWGRPTDTLLEPFMLARAIYIGILPLLLAAVAVILRPRGERLALALFGLVCALVVFAVPPVFQLVIALPVFESGHNTRLIELSLLCVALLAGWGLDDVVALERPARLWMITVAGALLVAVPLVVVLGTGRAPLDATPEALRVAWGFANPPIDVSDSHAGDVIRLGSVFVWLPLAAGALALVVLKLRGTLSAPVFTGLAVALVTLDLFRMGMGYNPAVDRDHVEPPSTPALSLLQREPTARFAATGPSGIPQTVLPMRFGLYEARGYDLPVDRRYDTLWRRKVSPEFSTQVGPTPASIPLFLVRVTPKRLRTLSLLGVKHVMQADEDKPLDVPGLRQVYSGEDARVYRNEQVLPRAWVVGAQKVVEGEKAALALLDDPLFDPRAAAITERPLPGLPRTAGSRRPGAARIADYEGDRVSLTADGGDGGGLLVLSDLHYPGWKATLDGNDVPVERVNYVMRGVRLPAGAHRVEFRYEPLSWRIGWIVSLLALLALAATVLWARRNAGKARAPRLRTTAAGPREPGPPA